MALFCSFLIAEWYFIVYKHHSFFTDSVVDGHLGRFPVLAVVNSAAVNTGVYSSFWIRVLFGYVPRSWVAGNSVFSFLRNIPYCFPQWLYQLTFPPVVYERSLFSTSSPAFVICRVFNDGHSDQCEVVPHYSFDVHFSNN